MKSCENCKWGLKWDDMDMEQQSVFIVQLYGQGLSLEKWTNFVLCTNGWWVVRRKDYVCEEWEPAGHSDK